MDEKSKALAMKIFYFVWVLLLALLNGPAHATAFQLQSEVNAEQNLHGEPNLIAASLPEDSMSSAVRTQRISQFDIEPEFSVGGLVFDGSRYQLLLETTTDSAAGKEVILATFSELGDLIANAVEVQNYSPLDIESDLSVGGLVFDGEKYILLLESDNDRAAGREIILAIFSTAADLVANKFSSHSFSLVNIEPHLSVGGFVFNQGRYHLLLETDPGQGAGDEILMISFNSFDQTHSRR